MDIIMHWIEHERLAPLGTTVPRDGGQPDGAGIARKPRAVSGSRIGFRVDQPKLSEIFNTQGRGGSNSRLWL